jgi:hypothetical protein
LKKCELIDQVNDSRVIGFIALADGNIHGMVYESNGSISQRCQMSQMG